MIALLSFFLILGLSNGFLELSAESSTRFSWGKVPARLQATTSDHSDGDPLNVLSWNILAPCYAKSPPPSWLNDSSFDQDWETYTDWTSYRLPRIIATLEETDADIVCLQEVQLSKLEELTFQLEGIGYQVHAQETRGHPVANVVLIRKALCWNVVLKESRSRALILVLQTDKDLKKNPPLFIVNVHLQASGSAENAQTAQTRFSQLQKLVKRINLAWKRIQERECNVLECDWGREPNLLAMGDFNLSPGDPLYTLIVDGKWPENGHGHKSHLPPKVSELTASTLPLLPLQDVRQCEAQGNLTPWTYAPTKQIFDYIFVSKNVVVKDLRNYVPEISADAEEGETTRGRMFWPNKYHPSDHIPIGATLTLQ